MKKIVLNTIILVSLSFGTFAQTLVQDLNPGAPQSTPNNLTAFGNNLYFTAYDIINGVDLWKYDGVTTSLVADTSTTTFLYYPEQLTVVGSHLYFVAHDGIHGWEVWRTDGVNTAMLPEIRPGNNTTKPSELFAFNSELYFQATDGVNGAELWKTDGTTNTLIDINPGAGNSSPRRFTVYNNTLYFTANDGTNGIELWKYDGVNATLELELISGSGNSNPYELRVLGNYLIFGADNGINGFELWKFDGTSATMIQDVNPGVANSNPQELIVIGNNLYFVADDNNGDKLMKYDGNAITEIQIGTGISNPGPYNLTAIGNELFFVADDGVHGYELWKYDGVSASMVQDITPGVDDSEIYEITKFGNLIYFRYEYNNEQLWKYDGVAASVVPVDTTINSYPRNLTVIGNTLYFSAFTPEFGEELWKIEGTFTSIEEEPVKKLTIYPNPASEYITIDVDSFENTNVRIIDITGKTVKTILPVKSSIDVSDLSKGTYVLQVQTGENLMSKKFIKQ